jgi:hypothetical protein
MLHTYRSATQTDAKVSFDANTIKVDYLNHILKRKLISPETLIINEFSNLNCGVRADLAVLQDEELHAVEIKSARDTTRRLHAQLCAYLKYFNRVTVVVDIRHLAEALALAEGTNVGVTLYRKGNFTIKKRSKKSAIDRHVIADSLIPSPLRPKLEKNENLQHILKENIKLRYHSNSVHIVSAINKGIFDYLDLENLNPHHVRRVKVMSQAAEIQRRWSGLVEAFKDRSNHLPSADSAEVDSPSGLV